METPATSRARSVGGRRKIVCCIGVFVLALVVRLAFVGLVERRWAPDSREYATFAKNLREHATFSLSTTPPIMPSIRRGPMYPVFLALVGGSVDQASSGRPRAAQGLLDALVAAMICLLAW